MAEFEVTVGDDFEVAGCKIKSVDDVERLAVLDERRKTFRHQMRLCYGVLAAFIVAVAASAVIGWRDGTYDELVAVVAFGGPWATLVVGRYFKKD